MSNTKYGFGGVGIIFVILIILGGGTYLWNKKSPAPTPPNVPADNSFKTLPAPATDTSAWKTYRNDEYGFEFKYPKESTVRPDGDGVVSIQLPFEQDTNLTGKSLQVVAASSPSCALFNMPRVSDGAPVLKNGISFTKQTGLEGGMNQLDESIRYVTVYNNSCISLLFNLHSGNYEAVYKGTDRPVPPSFNKAKEVSIFDQILSTFRFVK